MAEDAKKVKRRKSFSLLFGSTGLLGSDGFSATSRPKSHGHTRSTPDNSPRRCNAPPPDHNNDGDDVLGGNITTRRRGSRPRSSGSFFGIIGVKRRSRSFGDNLNMKKTGPRYVSRGRVSSTPLGSNDCPVTEAETHLWHLPPESTIRARSKSLQKSKRNSVFGSFRSLGTSLDDDQVSTKARSKESSGEEDDFAVFFDRLTLGTTVLHHGEVQTSAPMWRKKSQYLVLTDTHLVRFKNRSKAAEAFPSIPTQWGRNTGSTLTSNRLSVVSLASLQDSPLPGGGGGGDSGSGIALNRILAVHKLDDGRPFFSVEVCYMEDKLSKTSSLQIQLTDPLDAELWRSGIRDAATEARLADPVPFERDTVEYISRTLDQERDYDPYSMSMHRAVRRLPVKQGGRSSIDDNIKLASTPCYLVIGVHKIHILPLSKTANRASMVSLSELDMGESYGILSLAALYMQRGDDGLQLIFRLPFKSPVHIHLSSAFSADIALHIRQRAEYLRPQWVQQPYTFNVPHWLEDQFPPPPTKPEEDDGHFDRTLTAYCAAYDVHASNIRYSIDYSCEDAPCFQLIPPAGSRDGKGTISFGGVNLDVLQNLYDPYGFDYDAMRTRSNVPLEIPGQEQMSVLTQEIRALALKSKELKRLNFAFCLTRIPTTGKGEVDPGCGIPEAIFPLCRRRLTKVDWVVLNGIKLGDSDLDYLIDAASQTASKLRALEISHCGISIHDLDLIFHTVVNEKTVDSIAAYLASEKSSKLRELRLDQCGLTGGDVATFLYFMIDDKGRPRNIHLHVSENRLHIDYSLLFESIVQNKTPTHLTMRMMDFQKEDHFKQLIEALRKNKSLKYLDISKASLPYDAGPETCTALQMMFEENTTVEELDISGEYAHLDVARFGIGLNLALTGLKKNKTLKVLRIEHQKLGLQGASTLASVLEENDSLLEVYCENNEINLQSFTVLINGLQRNKTLLHLPCMDRDREQMLEKVRREIQSVNKESKRSNSNGSTGGSFRRTIQAAVNGASVGGTKLTKPSKPRQTSSSLISPSSSTGTTSDFTNPQVQAILKSLSEKWDLEVERLQRYLYRNYSLRHGIRQVDENGDVIDTWDALSDGRPKTATSLATFLDQFALETNQERLLLDSDAESQQHPEAEVGRMTPLRRPTLHKKLSGILSAPSPDPRKQNISSYGLPSSTQLDGTNGNSTPVPAHPRPMTTRTQTSTSFLSGVSSNASINTSDASALGIHRTSNTSKVTSASSSLRSILTARTQGEKFLSQKKKDNRVSVTFAHAPRLELDLPSLDLS
ncbi:hypothetical protein CIHG_07880 [Coccidioides immitis H538.4]|uniref:LRR-containing protein second PH domain-containing protein n=1 Tax=Coccidioides immitis H538.4 TaxID=396776 RepID=A0A0J8RZR6_COCIT|nr:hypothetical protein CIHG_07880 [Coccidioides immitis H538.4]